MRRKVPTKKLKKRVAAAPSSQQKEKTKLMVSKPKPSRPASGGKAAVKSPSKNTRTAASAADQNASFGMKEVKELISLIKDSGNFNTFAYKTDAFEIEINVGNGSIPVVTAAPQSQPQITGPAFPSAYSRCSEIGRASCRERV